MLFCTAVQPFRLHLPSLILHCQYKYFFLVFINFKNSNIIVNDQLFIFFSGIAAYQTVLVRFWKQFQLFYCLPNPIRLFFCSFRWQFFKCNISINIMNIPVRSWILYPFFVINIGSCFLCASSDISLVFLKSLIGIIVGIMNTSLSCAIIVS